MIRKISGEVLEVSASQVIIDIGPVALQASMPSSSLSYMVVGQQVSLETYLHISENHWELYGFDKSESLIMFRLLIAVSGVGPKSALGILDSQELSDLARTILEEDHILLSKAKGIGPKSAKKIIIELKDKVAPLIDANQSPVIQASEDTEQAKQALMALGFPSRQALAMLDFPHEGMAVADMVKQALAQKGKQSS